MNSIEPIAYPPLPPTNPSGSDREMILDSADRVLGAISVIPALIAAVCYLMGTVSANTTVTLMLMPACNLLLSRYGRAHSLPIVESVRAVVNFALAAYVYGTADGIFEQWWFAALTGVLGQCLIVCTATRTFLPGCLLTSGYSASVVIGAVTYSSPAHLGSALMNAFGVMAAGMLYSLVAARVGSVLQSHRQVNTLLHTRNTEIANSRNELYQFLEKMPLGVCLVDPQGRAVFANEEAKGILGRRIPPNADVRDLVSVYPRGTNRPYDDAKSPLTRALQGVSASADDIDVEVAGRRKPLYVKAAPIRGPQGVIRYALVTVEDISDKVRAETERLHGQKLESVGQLAAGVAHEINTPMQYIGDNAHFLETAVNNVMQMLTFQQDLLTQLDDPSVVAARSRLDAEAKKLKIAFLQRKIPRALRSTIEGVEAVSKIVRAMKEFSHPGSTEKTPTDINKAIETTITVSKNEWKYAADLDLNLADDLPQVPCLPGEINQVILNLIVNAAHAVDDANKRAEEQDAKGRIAITTKRVASGIELVVEDTGSGIPPEHIRKIYDPFFTTKEVGRGTGQGLAITRSIIVDKHGGTIDVTSTVGKGSRFTIFLPLRSPTMVPAPANDTLAQGAA